jgi:hypothetical protein
MKTIREYIDQLDEISRRDFLKGAGAVAAAGVASKASSMTDVDLDKMRQDDLARANKNATDGYTYAKQPQIDRRWYSKIIDIIGRNWSQTHGLTKDRIKAQATLNFTDDGKLLDFKISEPSGNADFDEALLNALARAQLSTKQWPIPESGKFPSVVTIVVINQ